ncbi:MAG: hypothetical protein LBC76_02730 [Treponema sp.]|nr:hypothetical protein [Treponema sp.]
MSTYKNKKKSSKIGIFNESSLHRTLKFNYTGTGGKTEVEVNGFVADGIKKNGEYIEVQTGSFAPLPKKLKEFVKYGKVRIIHPIALIKKIEVYSTDGKLLYRRKSPVKGSKWNIFNALIHAPQVPLIRGVTVEIVMVDITERRIKDGKGSRRRKGISLNDRELISWHESIIFKKPADYLQFIPFKKNEKFTSSLLSEQAGIDKWTAQKALYVLTKLKIVKRNGKKGNSWVYTRVK